MQVVVTGAQGFIGRALVKRLLTHGLDGHTVSKITAVDLQADTSQNDQRVVQVEGSIAEPEIMNRALDGKIDALFHLASIPGGAAERNYELGRKINLDATISLLEGLRTQATPAHVVFASSVAVYGENLPPIIDDQTLPAPALSYGAHKLMGEYLVADATRLGWIRGCSLRLPGVVARPSEASSGLMSAFMSELFWSLAAGKSITLPVSSQAVAWWISVVRCVDNLLHAATIDPARLNARRSYSMPVLRLTIKEVVDALAIRFGEDRHGLINYQPDARIERLFGAYPPLKFPAALELGFQHDGDVAGLVENSIAS